MMAWEVHGSPVLLRAAVMWVQVTPGWALNIPMVSVFPVITVRIYHGINPISWIGRMITHSGLCVPSFIHFCLSIILRRISIGYQGMSNKETNFADPVLVAYKMPPANG